MGTTNETVENLFAGFSMQLGDLNEDGNTGGLAGNIVKTDLPKLINEDGTQTILSYRFQYSNFGQRTKKIDPNGSHFEYHYDDNGYLTEKIEIAENKNVFNRYEHDEVGNLIGLIDGKNNRFEFIVNKYNQIIAEIIPEPLGFTKTYEYDGNNNLIKINDSNVDDNGNVRNDNPVLTTTIKYNELNRPITKIQEVAEGQTVLTEYQYDANENLTRIIEPEGNSIFVEYDERDLPYKITKGFSSSSASTMQIDYDGNKNKIFVENGEGNKTEYVYDGYDRLVRIKTPQNNITENSYNLRGNLMRTQIMGKLNGQSEDNLMLKDVSLVYDELDNITAMREVIINDGEKAGNRTTQYRYEDTRLVKIIDSLGNSFDYLYDGFGRKVGEIDPKGNKVEYIYDDNNNAITKTVSEISDFADNSPVYSENRIYDVLNRPVSITDNLGNTKQISYDSGNNIISSVDSRGNRTHYHYDGLNRLTEKIQQLRDTGSGSGNIVGEIIAKYSWDSNSRLIAVTDGNNKTTNFEYDALNRKTKTTLANNLIYQTKYDRNSNVIQTTDPKGFKIDYVYDNSDLLMHKIINKDNNHVNGELYEYDGLRKMVNAKALDSNDNITSTVSRTYNSLGNILSEKQNSLGVENVYNSNGQRIILQYPSGKKLQLNRDVIGRAQNINEENVGLVAQISWANKTQIGRMNLLNGTTINIEYDELKRAIKHMNNDSNATTMLGFESIYDKSNNRLYDKFLHTQNKGNIYSYDSLSQLKQITYGVVDCHPEQGEGSCSQFTKHESYTFDSVYNYQTKQVMTDLTDTTKQWTTTYAINDINAYSTITTTNDGILVESYTLDYDLNGNLHKDCKFIYEYDYRNLLTKVTKRADGSVIANYSYDALGRRISKISNDTTISYIYDGNNVIEERADENVIAEYIYTDGIDELISAKLNGANYYYLKDMSGNIVGITDNMGQLIDRYEYTAYGDVKTFNSDGEEIETSLVGNKYLYSSREYDSETGNYNYRFRTYNPKLGRFNQQDPLLFIDSLNQYAYVLNNPVNYTDPLGLARMAGNSGININNPLNSEFIDYVDRNYGFGEGRDGIADSILATALKPFAEYYRYLGQNYIAERLFATGNYDAFAYMKTQAQQSFVDAYFGGVFAGATIASAGTVNAGIGSATWNIAKPIATRYAPIIGTATTLAGQQLWSRGSQLMYTAQQSYYSAMSWAGSVQGQAVMQRGVDFVGGYSPGTSAPNKPWQYFGWGIHETQERFKNFVHRSNGD